MPPDTTHVIKKNDVAATGAVRPDPSVLLGTLKIPVEHVNWEGEKKGEEATARRRPRVIGEDASLSNDSFEVVTKAPEKPTRRRAAEQNNEDEEESEATVEEIEAEWARRLEKAVEGARNEGFEAGKEAARAEMEAQVQSVHESFASDLDAVQQAWEDHLKESRLRLVELAFRIARVILDAPLPNGLRHVSEAEITDAVERMVDGIPVEIALHPVSYLRMQEAGLEEQLSAVHSKLRWRSDPSLKENEWIVQCDRSAMRRLEAELLDELQRELSLRDFDGTDGEHDRIADIDESGDT